MVDAKAECAAPLEAYCGLGHTDTPIHTPLHTPIHAPIHSHTCSFTPSLLLEGQPAAAQARVGGAVTLRRNKAWETADRPVGGLPNSFFLGGQGARHADHCARFLVVLPGAFSSSSPPPSSSAARIEGPASAFQSGWVVLTGEPLWRMPWAAISASETRRLRPEEGARDWRECLLLPRRLGGRAASVSRRCGAGRPDMQRSRALALSSHRAMRATRRVAVDGSGRRETRIIALALPPPGHRRVRVTSTAPEVPRSLAAACLFPCSAARAALAGLH